MSPLSHLPSAMVLDKRRRYWYNSALSWIFKMLSSLYLKRASAYRNITCEIKRKNKVSLLCYICLLGFCIVVGMMESHMYARSIGHNLYNISLNALCNAGYLDALKQEGVPHFKQYLAGQTVYKEHQEPFDCDEWHVNFLCFKMGCESRQFLQHEVLKYTLVCLEN